MTPGVILGIDTATRTAAIGISLAGGGSADTYLEGAGLRTRALLGAVDELLRGAGATRACLTGVAVGVGPGSFTGLRVGIAAAQGIALGLGIPAIGVGTLECIARNAPRGARAIAVLVDAGRGEVFLGQFTGVGEGLTETAPPQVLSPGRAAELIPAGAIVLGDGWLRYRGALERLLGPDTRTLDPDRSRPRGSVVAALGAGVSAEAPGRPCSIEPVYVRAPDAKLYDPPHGPRAGSARASGG